MQPADVEPVLDRVPVEPETEQLPPRDDPVLPPASAAIATSTERD